MPVHVIPQPPQIRIRGRSFMAFVLAPEAPLDGWFAALDAHIARTPAFFHGRVVVLDCAAVGPDTPGWPVLIAQLQRRGIRVVEVTGLAAPLPGAEAFGTALLGGRDTGPVAAPAETPEPPAPPAETGLLVREPVRSGQTILFPEGDVTIVGSVASGAEVFAGGSIHVYGSLRGRAQAGAMGNGRAAIFCRRLEAELVSIDGFYVLAENIEPGLHGRAAQIRLHDGALIMTPLD
jgi:septum site-determining protein MinC